MNHKIAFVFPGQGSQSVGMLAEMAAADAIIEQTFAEASDVLGYDLWQLVQSGPETALNQTDKTQPAMLAAGVAIYRAWQNSCDVTPAVMAGHSLGEYSALVCAGAIPFAAAINLVEKRGRFMQQAVPAGEGAMAAILGLDDAEVIKCCEAAAEGDVIAAVNFNSPGQVVVAGTAAAVERITSIAKAAGAKRALLLPVSVPSHCELMRPAAEQMKPLLDSVEITAPAIPVIHNADVATHQAADSIRDALLRQLYNPVRWVESVQHIAAMGVDTLVECGPGKVLAGLNKRIDRSMTALPVFNPATLEKAIATVTAEG
ncbi:MAG TPA: [acyl-carrier-protein] S-malonyltransferase [Chromatiales bacterium]|nr:[acyl-carrier-protein] S-malonyltransferase [Chromatiales bacterium]